MTEQERHQAASRGVVAGLCPTTEANLGDGVFEAADWWAAGGSFGLGSDSNVCTSAFLEAMMLEYSQRLILKRRNILADTSSAQVATALVQRAVAGGARAAGRPIAGIARGQCADFVVLDSSDPMLAGLLASEQLSSCVFAQPGRGIVDVCVSGQWRIVDGYSHGEDTAAQNFAATRREIRSVSPRSR
jgi:formimidoylglutamate deiminase